MKYLLIALMPGGLIIIALYILKKYLDKRSEYDEKF